MDLVHIVVEGSGHLLEWNEDSGRLYLYVRHHPSKPSIVQKSQWQQTQSSWACAGLRALEHNRLAVFCRSDVSQRRDSRDCNDQRPNAEDGDNEGDTEAGQDISETSANDNGSDSASQNSGTKEPDNSDKDRSQDQSNINSGGIDTPEVQGSQNGNGKENREDDNQDKAAHDKDHVKINRLIEKIEKSIDKYNDGHDERTHTRIQTLWKRIDYLTSAQWDIDSLDDSEKNDPLRRVLHKLSLHRNLKKRIEQGAILGHTSPQYKKQYKEEMMQESPSFRDSDSNLQENDRRRFDVYLRQGAIFDKLYTLCAGSVALVAPILTSAETLTIDKHFKTFSESWEKTGVCKTASKFSDVVSAAVPRRRAKHIAKRTIETSDSNPNTSKRRRTYLDNGIVTSPTMPPTSDATHATSEETLHYPPGQRQQPSTSRIPSLQHLKHTNPLHPSGYKVSSGGDNGTNTNSSSEIAMDDTAQQSFRDLDPVSSSQSNPIQETQGSILNQGLQYSCQQSVPSKDRPIPEPDNFGGIAPGLHPEDTGSANYFTTYTEPTSGSHPDTGSANYFITYTEPTSDPDAGSANYFTTYTEPTSGSHPDTGSANYFTTYTEPTSDPDAGSANYFITYTEPTSDPDAGSANYFTTYTEPSGVFTAF